MSRFKLGIQLYSLRDEMEKDMDATLKKVAEMGYECVEFAGYFGHTAEEVKAMCEKYNLEPVSVHQTHGVFLTDAENSVNYLKTLGVKYCAIPYIGGDEWKADYDKLVSEIKEVGSLLKDNGIKLMYHNHDFELLIKHGDKFVLDALYDDVSTDLLIPQLDMCWVHYAGQDPVAYIKKYGDVEEVLHMKDFECKNLGAGPVYNLISSDGSVEEKKDKESDGFEFRPVGYGRQDVKLLLETAEDTKIKYVIVEQDMHPERSSLEDAKMSIDYLRSLGY